MVFKVNLKFVLLDIVKLITDIVTFDSVGCEKKKTFFRERER